MNTKLWVFFFFSGLFVSAGVIVFQLQRSPRAQLPARTDHIQPASPQQILTYVRELRSPVVLVNFWASWCEPCKQEFPQLLKLRSKLAAKGLKLVFVSIDEPRDLQAAESFLTEQHVDFQTFYKGSHQSLQFVTEIYPKWQGAVPTSLLVGRKMEILDAWEGDLTFSEFEERVLRQMRGS